jgi:hypothetical protein
MPAPVFSHGIKRVQTVPVEQAVICNRGVVTDLAQLMASKRNSLFLFPGRLLSGAATSDFPPLKA